MTVKELKKKLEGIPDNMYVMLMQTNDESAYNLVETVEVREIPFSEPDDYETPDEELPREEVLAITDEIY